MMELSDLRWHVSEEQKELLRIVERLKGYENEIVSINDKLENDNELAIALTKIDTLTKELNKTNSTLKGAREEILHYKKVISNLEEAIAYYKIDEDKFKKDISEKDKTIKQYREQENTLRTQVATAQITNNETTGKLNLSLKENEKLQDKITRLERQLHFGGKQ